MKNKFHRFFITFLMASLLPALVMAKSYVRYEKEGKTVIQLKLELRSPTLFFVFVFFYSIVMTFLVISIGVFTLGFNPLYSIIPVVAFLLIKLTMIAEFNRESDIIEKDLKNIFSTGNLHN